MKKPKFLLRCLLFAWVGSLMLSSKAFATTNANNFFNVYILKAKRTHYQNGCPYRNSEVHSIYSVSSVFIRTDGTDPYSCSPNNEMYNAGVSFEKNSSNPNLASGECKIPLVHGRCMEYWAFDSETNHVNLDDYSLKIVIYTQNNSNLTTEGKGEGMALWNPNNSCYTATIPLRKMLREGYQCQTSCELLELSLEPLCKPYIFDTKTLYSGYPYAFSTLARYDCSEAGYSVLDSIYLWEYSYDGLEKPKEVPSKHKIFSLNMEDDPDLPIGKNIVVSLLNGEPANSRNTRTVCFYPTIPQPTRTPIQVISNDKACLTSITLKFDRQLNADYNETITKITLYDSVAITNNNGVSESSILYQTSVNLKQLSSSYEYTLQLPYTLRCIEEGRYYVTVEGTSKGFSNNPNEEKYKDFPEEAKTAMMQVVPITVMKNKMEIYEVVFTPPTCYGGFGSAVVKIDKPANVANALETINFYWLKSSGERVRVNFQHKGTEISQYLYQYDSILPEMRNFEVEKHSSVSQIVIPGFGTFSSPETSSLSPSSPQESTAASSSSSSSSGSSSSSSVSGYFSIDFTQPEKMLVSADKKDVSGVYSVNGVMKNSNDGKAFLNKSACKGGTPPYKYYYYTTEVPRKTYFLGDTLRTSATRVIFVMEDKNLCEVDTFLQVKNLNKTLVTEVKLTQGIRCYKASDGILEVQVKSTNVSNMRYRWYKNGTLIANANQNILYNVGVGTYRSEVTDVETGMTSSDEIIVTQPSELKIAKETVVDNACHGEREGKISVTVSGGTGSPLLAWADGVFGAERKYLATGDYTLNVIDDNNCTVTKTYHIGQPEAPFEIVIDSVSPAVYGFNDQWQGGRIFSHAQGGTKPYNEPSVVSQKPENLPAGTHLLHQTDAMNCEDSKVVKIEQIPMLSVSILQTRQILCHGSAQGACRVNIEGGMAPYSIKWNNGQEDIGIENLQAGEYSVSVTDRAGAVKKASFLLTEPPALSLHRIAAKSPDYYGCMGGICTERTPNGFIELRVSGGVEPYTCTWKKDGAYLFDFDSCRADSLGGGIYQIDVSDKNGCQVQLVEVLESTPDLNAHIAEKRSILCFGSATGTLAATVEGGKQPFSYQWYRLDTAMTHTFDWDSAANLIGNNAEITDLNAGCYGLKVTDRNGVISKTVHILTQKTPLVITVDSVRLPSYAGSVEGMVEQPLPDGFIRLHFTGGTSPYFCKWSDVEGTSEACMDIQRGSLPEGDYHLSVYDQNNCRVDTAFTLPHRENLRTRMWIADSISCFESGDGVLGAEISGGVKPYSFVWKDENGETVRENGTTQTDSLTISSCRTGKYFLYVEDSNKVMSMASVILPQPELLSATAHVKDATAWQFSNGSICMEVRGGTRPYSFSWNGTAGDTCLYGLKRGRYTFEVQDARGCETHSDLRVSSPDSLVVVSEAVKHTRPDRGEGAIYVNIGGGLKPYSYAWTSSEGSFLFGGKSEESVISLDSLEAGLYRFVLQDSGGASISRLYEVKALSRPQATLFLIKAPDCPLREDAVLQALIQGGTAPYTGYLEKRNESTGLFEPTGTESAEPIENGTLFQNLPAGTYRLCVSDASRQTVCDTLIVHDPENIRTNAVLMSPSCYGLSDGRIEINPTGEHGDLLVFWSNGEEGFVMEDIPEGTYSLRIYDQNQCLHLDTLHLEEPSALRAENFVNEIECSYACGRIRLSGAGGTAPYLYRWRYEPFDSETKVPGCAAPTASDLHTENFMPQADIVFAPAGAYTFIVQDSNGCLWDTVILLTAPPAPAYTWDSIRYLCQGQSIEIGVTKTPQQREIDNRPADYIWTYPDGSNAFEAKIETRQAGLHSLTLVQDKRCFYKDSVWVEELSDTVGAEFWVSSYVLPDESCLLVNLSKYQPDSVVWMIPQEVTVIEKSGNYIEVSFPAPGIYTLGLNVYKGLCWETIEKTVTVSAPKHEDADFSDPYAPRWKVYPNPSQGICTLEVTASSPLKAQYSLMNAFSGIYVERGEIDLSAAGTTSTVLFKSNPPAGLYILLVKYGEVRHGFKLIRL